MNRSIERRPLILLALCLSACGGGGGGGGAESPPPPPPAAVTHSVELTSLELEDTRFGDAVAVTGLPLSGATATVD